MIHRVLLASLLCSCPVLALRTVALEAAQESVAKEDVPFLDFGKLHQFDPAKKVDWKDPNQATAYSVTLCRQGKIEELLNEMQHVGNDAGLPLAIRRAVALFGPELTKYKDEDVRVKLLGYSRQGADRNAFFYYLVKKDGTHFKTMPWVETWRSVETGRCSIVNIYAHDPADPTAAFPIPDDLITSIKKQK